ncbi:MAG: putative type pilus assembly protein [Phycisphaerales bacterium]|nr:putative type pilus assembly protein [Phycisphaerales bacterium]
MDNPYLDIKNAGGNRQLVLRDEPITIGRHADNKLVLTDNMASRFHCVIELRGDQYILRDLGASNGTRLNGKLVKAAALSPGDVVTIGQTNLVLVLPGMVSQPGRPNAPTPSSVVYVAVPQAGGVPQAVAPPFALPPGAASAGGTTGAVPLLGTIQMIAPPARPAGRRGPPAPQAPPDGLIPLDGGDAPTLDEEVEELTEDDLVVEEPTFDLDPPLPVLGDDDIVELGEPLPAGPDRGYGSAGGESALISLVRDDPDDYESTLWAMAEAQPDKFFAETDIALLDARGAVQHPAGKPLPPGPRQPPDVLRLLLLVCFRSRATDVHLEPREGVSRCRIRVDGVMVDAGDFPSVVGQRLTGVVKVLSQIDLSQRNAVQEGHFAAAAPGGPGRPSRRVDYRVSFAPSVNGQKLVIRVLDPSTAPARLADLKLSPELTDALGEAIEQESGMVLVCGPTGSGKTSTLYSLIRSIDAQQRNVVTIEDPVEIRIDHATQIPVDDAHGNTFPVLLRSVLRQDPDVILVGEIRDAETARVAMQASITGHLVFSTVHTKDSLGTVHRLLDLGVEPYLLAQGLQVIIAQRLVRKLCPFCKQAVGVTADQRARMGAAAEGLTQTFVPRGCPRCLGTGFHGRTGVFELLRASDDLRDLISRSATAGDMRKSLEGTPFVRLPEAGFRLVADGTASFEEVDKAVGR